MDSPPAPPPPTTRPRSNTFSGGSGPPRAARQPPAPTIATMRQHLRSVGHGDLIDPLAAVLLQSPRGPRRSSSEANIRAGPSYGALAKRPGHKQALSAYLRLEFLRSGRAEVSPPPMLAHDDVEARSPPRRARAAPSFDYPQFRTDVMATCVAFVVTCVIYASTAQAIFGKLDPRLVFVGVDGALLGTALTGIVFALRSQVPWCIASTDVGFAPLLAQLADQCWKAIAPTKKHTFEVWSFEEDGALSYAAVPADTRRDFVATWVAASSLIFLLCGGVLWALGAFKLTRVVNFMPYPVISGMLASIGVSLCKSGARVAAAPGFRVSHQLGALWLSCALVLALFMRLARRSGRVPTWLPPVAVVLVSSVAMYLGILIYDVDASEAAEAGGLFDWDPAMLATARGWAPLLDIDALGGPIQVENVDDDAEVGAAVTEAPFCVLLMRRASLKHLSHRFIQGLAAFATHVQWQVVFQCRGVILAAVTLGAIKIGLKTGAFPALFPNEAICADAEVAMVGCSNVCLGLLGVQGVAYSFSSLKLAEQVGASRRGVGLCLPILCLLCWALGYAFLRHVPRFACGALLLDLGWDYVDTYLVGQISRGVVWTDVDVLAVFAVVATAIAASLLEAVAVGVVLCLAGTASRLARESVVAATLSGVDARSAVERSSRAQRRLDALGDAIRVLSGRLLAAEPSHAEARRLLSALRERSKRERAMFGGVFDRAAASGGAADDEKGLYSEAALRAQEEARRAELDRLMKVENLAKLPPDQWAQHVGGLGDAKREQLLEETRELSRDMPDGAWQKHVANMGPEAVEQARAARRLIDAQREAKEARQALLGDDAEGEGEDEESDFFFDRWIDSLGAKGLLGVLAAVGLGAALVPMVVAAMAAA